MAIQLNPDQKEALAVLKKPGNVFVTGAAGSGKSFLIGQYLKENPIPILASTGAAAILVGGRTFHSFFGLGILEGGISKTVERALNNKRLVSRIQKTSALIIDEISMISGPVLRTAELVARKAKENSTPWGGIKMIAVGDFAQLPPVNPFSPTKEWAFRDEVWHQSEFTPVVLNEPMRTQDADFLKVLNHIRDGRCSEFVRDFLNSKVQAKNTSDMTCLFPLRDHVEKFNLDRLKDIKNPLQVFQTSYSGKEKDIENFRKNSPLPDVIQLKEDALVMLRQNDPEGRWVNGTTGLIEEISDSELAIRLNSGRRKDETIKVPIAEFTLLNAEGEPVVTAKNFPVTLAWAMTIHKSQGTTLDPVRMDLRRIWEPGQAYVALSRAKDPRQLYLEGWDERAIIADRDVSDFHARLKH